jgi:hypothetical protein
MELLTPAARAGRGDRYGLELTTSAEAARAYNEGVGQLLRVRAGGINAIAESITHDPAFALGHSALALLGHEYCAAVDVDHRLQAARMLAPRATERERSHVYAVERHIAGDSSHLVGHLETYPRDALLLSVAVPTIAFAGVTTVQEDSWAIVERAEPAYGDDWWYTGLLAFIRQEQGRFDEAMALSRRSMATEPAAGHSVHARTHVHYETGDHLAGRNWLDDWIHTEGRSADNLVHYSWHAALHELSMGDFDAVRARYAAELAPPTATGCRALVDSCSLLWRWAITPGAGSVPDIDEVIATLEPGVLDAPPTAFMALHAAVTLCAMNAADRLERLADWSGRHPEQVYRDVVSPLATALMLLVDGRAGAAADRLAALLPQVIHLGGSDAQREVVEDTLIAALLRAERFPEARAVIDRRLDRRVCRRDLAFHAATA